MAQAQSKSFLSTEQQLAAIPWLDNLTKRSDIIVAFGVVGIIILMIIPIPSMLLDVLIAANIAFALIVLMVAMYAERSLEFSVFPGLLLILTLFRLGINVASTRMILGDGYAGKIIESFGGFVIKGNYIVGIVIFLILVAINFMVITKGSGRIAEVAARFTLDAMPGKQMAVDADMNNGVIDEQEARVRREDIRREADFYGAMDGAAKFVSGDAKAGILITFINIIGGLVVGMVQLEMSFAQALKTYTTLTIGDGLVSQIPALIISVSAGIIVARAASEMNLGREFTSQLFVRVRPVAITSFVLAFFALVPGMPTIPFLMLSAGTGFIALQTRRSKREHAKMDLVKAVEGTKPKEEEKIEDYLYVDPMELEIGYGLIPLVDNEQEGDLLSRITMIRKQQAIQMGIVIPPVRIRDNIQLKPSEYVLKIRGNEVARGELKMGHFLALDPGTAIEDIDGIPTKEPTYGLPALWISANNRDKAENSGYTVVEPTAVLATHLVEIIKANSHKLLARKDVNNLIENLRNDNPTVIEELIPNLMTIGGVHKVLQKLLKESIPIRDLGTIMETLADYSPMTKDTDLLVEYVRYSLSASITQKFREPDNNIYALTLDPEVEQVLLEASQQSNRAGGRFGVVDLPPAVINAIYFSLSRQVDEVTASGRQPILVCSPTVRQTFRKLTEPVLPQLVVLSYGELLVNANVESLGTVDLKRIPKE